jgi:hypothetical protein
VVKLAIELMLKSEPGVVVPIPILLVAVSTKREEVAERLVPAALQNANCPVVPEPMAPLETPEV